MLVMLLLPLALSALAHSSPVPHKPRTLAIDLRSALDSAQCNSATGWTYEKARQLMDKFERLTRSPQRSTGVADVDLELFRYQNQDLVYYGTIQVGNPPQDVTVTFDSGSTDLWLPVLCKDGPHGFFNRTQSRTYKQSITPFSFFYGTGSANGSVAVDSVTIAGMTVPKQYFGAALSWSESYTQKPSAGLMGLSLYGLTQLGHKSFIYNLMESGALAQNEFSFYHARNGSAGSQLVLGGFDAAHAASEFTWFPNPSDAFWGLEVDAWTANGVDVPNTKLKVTIDTGVTQIIVPKRVAKAIYGQFSNVRLDEPDSALTGYDYYEFPCNSTVPDIGIRFSGSLKNFPINPFDMIIGVGSSEDYCIAGVIGVDINFHSDTNIGQVGVTWLKNYLARFSFDHFDGKPAIAFADAK